MFYRIVTKIAILAGPLLILTELIAGFDQMTNGRISALCPWFPLLTPWILSAAIVSQMYICAVFARRCFDAKQYRNMMIWLILAVPPFITMTMSNMVTMLQSDEHLSFSAALTQFGFTRNTIVGMAVVMGIYVSFVGERIRRALKEQKEQKARQAE